MLINYVKILFLLSSFSCIGQVIISNPAIPYQQDFNGLSSVSTTNSYATLPLGWTAKEIGLNANLEYRADYGSLAGGDLYSYGDNIGVDSLERALGSIGSGTLTNNHFGVYLVNSSPSTIQSITVSYTGELWRVGNAQRSTGEDTLHFSYAINAGSIDDPIFTPVSTLSFISPAGSMDPRNQESVDGNSLGQNANIQQTIAVLIAPNDTLWLKWYDFNSSSYDDGLAIDDLLIEFDTISTANSLFGEIALFDTYYNETFNSLGNLYSTTYDFSTLPKAWFARENGSNAETTYRASFGDYSAGNIYSFSDSLSTERAFGSIGSGSLSESNYGSAWINTTGQVINNVEISYTGEMWRQGNTSRSTGPDTLHFSYAVNAADIQTGNYLNYDFMSFYTPVLTGNLNTATDGNNPTFQSYKTSVLGNLNLQPNDTLWVRWTDANSSSYDDGLAIDDFSLAALTTASVLTVQFEESNTYVSENDGIISIPISIANPNNFLSQVEVSIESIGTIDLTSDINLTPAIVSFPANSGQITSYFNFEVLNSLPFENDEYFVLKLSNPSNAFLGVTIYDTIHIINYNYPVTLISDLKTSDGQGVADSLGANVAISGIVHGVNFNYTDGLDFYLMDNTGGINIYNATQMLSYNVQEGDELKVWGMVGQFAGLTRIQSIDSIEFVTSTNPLKTALQINSVVEANESTYIEIDSLVLVPQIANWPTNLAVQAINISTQDTISIFVSSNSTLANQAAPSSTFTLVGIGSQKSESLIAEYLDGYRIMALDIQNESTASISNLNNASKIVAYPNPVSNQLILNGDLTDAQINIASITGEIIVPSFISTTNNLKLDMGQISPGIYFVSIRKGDDNNTIKIIKK
jgi:hypothetical protein